MGNSTPHLHEGLKYSTTHLNQWNEGIFLGEHQPTVDGLKVINNGIQREVLLVVDGLQPLQVAVTEEGVAAWKNISTVKKSSIES